MKDVAVISDDPQYGGLIEFKNSEVADEFDDFLTENYFVLYQTKFENENVIYYFGKASSVEKLEHLLSLFFETEKGD